MRAGRWWTGALPPGPWQVTAPGVPVRATFEAPAGRAPPVCHAGGAAPNATCGPVRSLPCGRYRAGLAQAAAGPGARTARPGPGDDTGAGRRREPHLRGERDLAIVSRLVAQHCPGRCDGSGERQPGAAAAVAPARATDCIDAHLSEAIGLADIAQSTGLTRVHFAAQFRRATALRPQPIPLRRRVEHAQSLLSASSQSILDKWPCVRLPLAIALHHRVQALWARPPQLARRRSLERKAA